MGRSGRIKGEMASRKRTGSRVRHIHSVRYDQEFHHQGRIWHVIEEDSVCRDGTRFVRIKDRNGYHQWIDWNTFVEVVDDRDEMRA